MSVVTPCGGKCGTNGWFFSESEEVLTLKKYPKYRGLLMDPGEPETAQKLQEEVSCRTHHHHFTLPLAEAYPWHHPAAEPSPVPCVTPRFPAACLHSRLLSCPHLTPFGQPAGRKQRALVEGQGFTCAGARCQTARRMADPSRGAGAVFWGSLLSPDRPMGTEGRRDLPGLGKRLTGLFRRGARPQETDKVMALPWEAETYGGAWRKERSHSVKQPQKLQYMLPKGS